MTIIMMMVRHLLVGLHVEPWSWIGKRIRRIKPSNREQSCNGWGRPVDFPDLRGGIDPTKLKKKAGSSALLVVPQVQLGDPNLIG